MKINLLSPKLAVKILILFGCLLGTGCTSDTAEPEGQVNIESGDIAEMSRLSLARKQALALFDKGQIPYHDVALHTYMILRNDPLASAHERDVAQRAARLEIVPAYKPVRVQESKNQLNRAPVANSAPGPEGQAKPMNATAIPPGLRLKRSE